MGARIKKAAIIYLILVGLGVGAYFGIKVMKSGYSSTVGGGGVDIFSTAQDTKTSSTSGGSGSQIGSDDNRPTSQMLKEFQQTEGSSQSQAGPTEKQSTDTSQNKGMNLAQMAGVAPVDTSSNITPTPGNIKTPVNQTQSGSEIKIKPQIDLSGGALGGSKTSAIDISGGIDLGSSGLSGGGPKIDFSKVDVPGTGSAKKVTGSKSGPNPLTADMEKQLKSLYYDSHNLSAAKAKAREILKLDPTNSTAKRYLSIIKAEQRAMKYEDAGESEKALAEWKKILKWDPNNRWAKKGVSRNQ